LIENVRDIVLDDKFQALRAHVPGSPSLAEFDLRHLPEEVRRNSFFV